MEYKMLMDRFKTERKYMEYGNYYPSSTSRKSFVYTIFGLFMFLYSWTELASMLAVLYFEFGNLAKLSETLLFCMTQIAFLTKLTNFIVKRKSITRIESFLKHPILNDLNETQESILDSYVVPFRRLSHFYRMLCILVVIFYGIFPFIDRNSQNLIPLPGWFPFDVETYQYEIIGGQVLGIAIGAFNNSNIDILNAILMTFGSAQFEVLKDKLENAVDSCRINGRIQEAALKKVLRTCAKHHQILIDYTEAVQDMFSAGIFVQFACSVMVICLTGFQMLVISFKSVQFVLLILYFSTMTCQIALYCWYGNELIHNSSGIPEACYMSDWDESDSETQKLFWIIMERGKRPVTVKAASFFTLSLTTLMAILRSSYSYFALLQRVYGKID